MGLSREALKARLADKGRLKRLDSGVCDVFIREMTGREFADLLELVKDSDNETGATLWLAATACDENGVLLFSDCVDDIGDLFSVAERNKMMDLALTVNGASEEALEQVEKK